ncbi:MAG: hypothetical protein RL398_2785 [Planctomycetota bacterium]|jgi:hypothetical protein
MSKHSPDHHDAEIVLKFYDLRREPVMRESRDAIIRDFWPRTEADALAILTWDHPLNRAYRQVASYWEMVYGMAKYGVVNTDFLLESNGEGLFLYAKMEPYLEAVRKASSPRAFEKAEWVANSSDLGKKLVEMFRQRVKKQLGQ